MSHTILITGATGFIGGNLVRACVAKGWSVRALVLPGDPAASDTARNGAEIHIGNICDPSSLTGAFQGADIVFHCAGLVTDWAPEAQFRTVMEAGTANVCEAALAAGVRRLVHVSTNDVFGLVEGEVIDEAFPRKPWGEPYPDFKILAEERVWAAHARRLAVSVVYPCWVYGEGDRTFVPLLADAIEKGEMVFWRRNALMWPAYIGNVVDLMLRLATDERAVGKGFLVHDGQEAVLQDFCAAIAEAMGHKPPGRQIPYGLAMMAARILEFAWKVTGRKSRPLLTTYAVKNLGSQLRFSIARAEVVLGWKPPVPYQIGLERTLDWLRAQDLSKLVKP